MRLEFFGPIMLRGMAAGKFRLPVFAPAACDTYLPTNLPAYLPFYVLGYVCRDALLPALAADH